MKIEAFWDITPSVLVNIHHLTQRNIAEDVNL